MPINIKQPEYATIFSYRIFAALMEDWRDDPTDSKTRGGWDHTETLGRFRDITRSFSRNDHTGPRQAMEWLIWADRVRPNEPRADLVAFILETMEDRFGSDAFKSDPEPYHFPAGR